jgi:AcrR family transcriptional regulator
MEHENDKELTLRVLQEANQLFFRYGVKSITMDQIAQHLGISKKTIYTIVADKKELVHMVVQHRLERQNAEMDELMLKAKDPVHEIILLSAWVQKMFEEMNPFLMMEIQKYFPQTYAIIGKHKSECVYSHIYSNLEKGKELGLYRSSIDIEVISRLRMLTMEASMNPDNFPLGKKKMAEIQVQMIEHFLHGICTLKGHKLINSYKQIIEEE